MKAVQMTEQGGPEVLRLTELPIPAPGPGEVLVKVDAAGVNFADLTRRRGGRYPVPTPLPFVPGSEVAGTVAALGEGVEGPAVGTPVFGVVGADGSGGYAEYSLAPAHSLVPVPDGISPAAAAGIFVAGLTASLILGSAGQVTEGDTVFVPAAAGGVGSYAVQIARLLRAGTVIAGAGTAAKREAALALGADHAVSYREPGWTDAVLKLTEGRGVDVALEMSGPAHLGETLAILAPFGRLVNYGSASGTMDGLDPAALFPLLYDPAASQVLTGFSLGTWFGYRLPQTVAALQQLVGWVASGQLRTPDVRALPLSEAAQAHRLMESGQVTGKLVLQP
jgi:NADPH:quinone reductase-like Zn-dependent oxidoreductase